MHKNIWPTHICSLDFAIVAMGVPAQWNLAEFELDIKKQYSTIIQVEHLYIKGGISIPKVRTDFSSNQEISKITENKNVLLDDDNTSFVIQPYSPPLRIHIVITKYVVQIVIKIMWRAIQIVQQKLKKEESIKRVSPHL
jgi:hypothetical protein